jgi:hypothetical protein
MLSGRIEVRSRRLPGIQLCFNEYGPVITAIPVSGFAGAVERAGLFPGIRGCGFVTGRRREEQAGSHPLFLTIVVMHRYSRLCEEQQGRYSIM